MSDVWRKGVGLWLGAFVAMVGSGSAAAQTDWGKISTQMKDCSRSGSSLQKCLGSVLPPDAYPWDSNPRPSKGGIFCHVLKEDVSEEGLCKTPVWNLQSLGDGVWVVDYVQLQPDFPFSDNKLYAATITVKSKNIGTGQKLLLTEEITLKNALSSRPFKIFNVVPLVPGGSIGKIYFRYLR